MTKTVNLGLTLAPPNAFRPEWSSLMDTNLQLIDAAVGTVAGRTSIHATTNYTAVAGDFVFVNSISGPITITIPAASANAGKTISVKKVSSDSNLVTLARSGSDLLEFDTSITFDAQGVAADLESDGVSAWSLN